MVFGRGLAVAAMAKNPAEKASFGCAPPAGVMEK
jgi:hypothetical protein